MSVRWSTMWSMKRKAALLAVALLSNIMAIILQSLCDSVAIASGRDLAQACPDTLPRSVAYGL